MLQQLAFRALQRLQPELAHDLTLKVISSGLVKLPRVSSSPLLSANLCGLEFPNPLAVSAGFDKNADVPDALLGMGLGFAEVGTVTPLPQYGNQKPRIFRLRADEAIINRYGFNSAGFESVLGKLKARRLESGTVGVNIGANKDSQDKVDDFVKGLRGFSNLASYVAVNVSSPNTPGLRTLQASDELRSLLEALMGERRRLKEEANRKIPIFLKIAPDMDDSQLNDICQAVLEFGVEGMIVSNTTVSRPSLTDADHRDEIGGLSGRPLFEMSTRMLAKTRNLVGPELILIGVGGIDSGEAAWKKILAGANLLQLYTSLTYHGFNLVREILDHLAKEVERNKLENLQQAVGTNLKDWLE